MSDVEPRANVWRFYCPECARHTFDVISVPELSTGMEHPVVARCSACGFTAADLPPFDPDVAAA